MPSSLIRVTELVQEYQVPVIDGDGFLSVLRQRKEVRRALHGISFDVSEGEILGFIGPNGSGKTTTLKIISGVLKATSGDVDVCGHQPWKRQKSFLKSIGLVLGQKSQLVWQLPAMDSFNMIRAAYGLSSQETQRAVNELGDILAVSHRFTTPVRKLSLGERMKCELICALIHRPRVLLLDEPTIGLDVASQQAVRTFLKKHALATGCAVILTSHDMNDLETLADRILLLRAGKVEFSGRLMELQEMFSPGPRLVLSAGEHRTERLRELGMQPSSGMYTKNTSWEEGRAIIKEAMGWEDCIYANLAFHGLEEIMAEMFARDEETDDANDEDRETEEG